MATYYVDFEGAAGLGNGLSFANRADRFASIAVTPVAGDTIRIKASPSVTSLGDATWNGAKRDISLRTISSSTNASPIVITSPAAHGLVSGNYVSIINHSTNTNANGIWLVGSVPSATTFQILQMDGSNTIGNGVGSSGTFNNVSNCIVKTASPLVKNIALCGGLNEKPLWVASTNVTRSQLTTQNKEGYTSAQIAIGAAFTTGKAAYHTLPATLDLSAYQQVSFWLRLGAGVAPAFDGQLYLALCSDTIGNAIVNTINIPFMPSAGQAWEIVTVDLKANLGNSIASVALYVTSDVGTQTIQLDNIIACKASSDANSLTLSSIISKGNGVGEWFPIQSINHDAIMLANINANLPSSTSIRGYYGVSETVTTYKREPFRNLTTVQFPYSGSYGQNIVYSGGWNRTDMSTQSDYTWFDGASGRTAGLFYGYDLSTFSNVTLERLNAVRYQLGIYAGGQQSYISDCSYIGCSAGISVINNSGNGVVFTKGELYLNNNGLPFSSESTFASVSLGFIKSVSNCSSGFALSSMNDVTIQSIENAFNMGSIPVSITTGCNNYIGKLIAADNQASYAVTITTGRNNVIGSGSSTGHSIGGFSLTNGTLFVNDFTVNEPIDVTITGTSQIGVAYFNRLDNTDKNSWIYNWPSFGTINQQTSIVDSPATSSWRMIPSSKANYSKQLKLKLATIVVSAGSLVTVTARMRQDVLVPISLVCPSGQIAGVEADVIASAVNTDGTWETVSITFTPTNNGAVDIYAYAYARVDAGLASYVSNLTVTQA